MCSFLKSNTYFAVIILNSFRNVKGENKFKALFDGHAGDGRAVAIIAIGEHTRIGVCAAAGARSVAGRQFVTSAKIERLRSARGAAIKLARAPRWAELERRRINSGIIE